MQIKFKKLDKAAVIPKQGTAGSAGFDLTAISKEQIDKFDEFLFRFGTGIAVEIPKGFVGLVFPRSSVYKNRSLLTNCVGVIDSDYRGEIKAVFACTEDKGYQIGDRIMQLVIMPCPAVEFVEVDELSETERGTGGYGSTGR